MQNVLVRLIAFGTTSSETMTAQVELALMISLIIVIIAGHNLMKTWTVSWGICLRTLTNEQRRKKRQTTPKQDFVITTQPPR